MTAARPPAAPRGLATRQRRLWRQVLEVWELTAVELRVLEDALRLSQRADEAQELVDKHGVVVTDRYGSLKTNPAVDVETRCRTSSARLFSSLKLPMDDNKPRRRGKPGPRPARHQLRTAS